MGFESIFYITVLVFSVILHEISHGYVAEFFGDPTARLAGRLTLNPIPHIDILGSIILPVLMVFSGSGVIFGWAKPVPYNPYNLKSRRMGEIAVSAAGVLANLLIAFVFSLLIRFGAEFDFGTEAFMSIAKVIVLVNLMLAIFNLVPIPPLDGSKLLFSVLPARFYYIEEFLQRYALIFLIVFIFMFSFIIIPIVYGIFNIFTGIAF